MKNYFRALETTLWTVIARTKFFMHGFAFPKNSVCLGPIGVGGSGSVEIGPNARFIGHSRYNRAGVNRRCEIAVEKNAKLKIGKNVGLSGSAIYCTESITIGDFVLLGVNSGIYDTDFHSLDCHDRRNGGKGPSDPVWIGDNVWLGANVLVLKGVVIGNNTVIGAGSVVTGSIPPNCVAAGNPCRVIRFLVRDGR